MYSPERETGSAEVFGPAFTIHMVPESEITVPTLATPFIESLLKDSVVFLSQPKATFNSVWGGLMSTRAQILKSEDVIIDEYF
jgi:regulator of RNase E activity RraA